MFGQAWRRHLLLVVSVISFLLLICFSLLVKPSIAKDKEMYKVGGSWSFSGPYSATSAECYKGAVLAFEEIEALGGVNGHPLKHVYLDDGSDVNKATANFKKFVADPNMISVTGGYFICLPLVELSARAKIPFFATSACGKFAAAETPSKYDMATWATSGPGYPPVWQNDPWGEYKGDHLRMIRELKLPIKKIAILYNRVGILENMGLGAEEFYKKLPGEFTVVLVEGFGVGTKDFTAQILKLKELKPDAVISQLVASDAALLVRQMRELDYTPPLLYAGFSAPTPDFIKGVGEEFLEGITGIEYLIEGMPAADVYIKKFEERWGYKPEYHSAYSYEHIWEIYYGIKACLDKGLPVTGENVWKEIHELKLPHSPENHRVLSALDYLKDPLNGSNARAAIRNFQYRKGGIKEMIYSPFPDDQKFVKPIVFPQPAWAGKSK